MSLPHPPEAWFVIDELSLYREVGSAEIMAGQVRRLREVAAMRTVTVQVLRAVAHCANASAFIVADGAAYAEHVVAGYVFTDDETVAGPTGRACACLGDLVAGCFA